MSPADPAILAQITRAGTFVFSWYFVDKSDRIDGDLQPDDNRLEFEIRASERVSVRHKARPDVDLVALLLSSSQYDRSLPVSFSLALCPSSGYGRLLFLPL